MNWKPTEQQQAVHDAIVDGTENLAVNAVAGAAKTTTGVWSAGDLAAKTTRGFSGSARIGFLAFNKHIATELQSRLQVGVEASTFHSLGYRILREHFPGVVLNAGKLHRHLVANYQHLMREGRGRWAGRWFLRDEWEAIPDVVGILKQAADPETVTDGVLICSCDLQGVSLPREADQVADLIDTSRKICAETLGITTACDYPDMIAMPLHHGIVSPRYDCLLVDECQDLDPAKREMALRLSGRLVVIGDPHQSIMGFAGADVHSFGRLGELLSERPNGYSELPLSVSFRCPGCVVPLASALVPHFSARGNAPVGDLGYVDLECEGALSCLRAGDMVICRNNAPVVSIAYQLIGAGVPAIVRGRAIGDGLVALVRRLVGRYQPSSVSHLIQLVETWAEREVEKLDRREGTEQAVAGVRDRAACCRAVAHGIGPDGQVGDVATKLDRMFSDESTNGKVVLSSIHRAKGLEADRVILVDPGRIRDGEQEANLAYVAVTRPKKTLLWTNTESCKHKIGDGLDGLQYWINGLSNGSTKVSCNESLYF